MEQILKIERIGVNPRWGMILGFALLMGIQGVIFFGPEVLGSWAHDAFHTYRHTLGMPCH